MKNTSDTHILHSLVSLYPEVSISNVMTYETGIGNHPQRRHDRENKLLDYSLKGKAFNEMDPLNARIARRSPFPALVLSLHDPLEELREAGIYETSQKKLRKRDMKIQGSVQPILVDFG